MFRGCSPSVQRAGQWNMEHRGKDFARDYIEKNVSARKLADAPDVPTGELEDECSLDG